MPARIWVGRDVRVVRETADGLEIEGPARLRPGGHVEVVLPRAGGSGIGVRRALVWTWSVAELGSDGPLYRGFCRWD
jgi:hypothetical protein